MRQTRGALKFLLAEYRAVLKNAMLAMILAATAGSGCAQADAQTVYLGNVTVNEQSKTFETSGTVDIGINDDKVVITNIKTEGSSAEKSGIAITGNTSESAVNVLGKDITISSDWRGIYANPNGVASNKSTVNIGNDSTEKLVIEQKGAVDTKQNDENGMAVIALKPGTTVNLKAKEIDISSVARYTAHAQSNDDSAPGKENAAYLNIEGDSIRITNTNSYINGAGISAFSGSKLDVTGNLYVKAAYAIDARGNSTININNTDGNQHSTVIDGDVVFETNWTKADGHSSGSKINSNVNLNLTGENSSWTGSAYQQYQAYKDKNDTDGTLTKDVALTKDDYNKSLYGDVTGFNLTIANGAKWDMTGDSFVNTAKVSGNGTINLLKDAKVFNAGDLTLDGGKLNAQSAVDSRTITVKAFKAENESSVDLNNTSFTMKDGNAKLSAINASGKSSFASEKSNAIEVGNVTVEKEGNFTLSGGATIGAISADGANVVLDKISANGNIYTVNGAVKVADLTANAVTTLNGTVSAANVIATAATTFNGGADITGKISAEGVNVILGKEGGDKNTYKVGDSVTAAELTTNGETTIGGAVTAKTLTANAATTVTGAVNATTLNANAKTTLNGGAKISGGIAAKDADVTFGSGTYTVTNGIIAKTLTANGNTTITGGTVNADTLTANGVTTVENALTVTTLTAKATTTLNGGAEITGNVEASGADVIFGAENSDKKYSVGGALTAKNLTANGETTLNGGATISESLNALGTVILQGDATNLYTVGKTITGIVKLSGGTLKEDDLSKLKGTLEIADSGILSTTSSQIYTNAASDTQKDSGAVKTSNITYTGGTLNLTDDSYTLKYATAAKTALADKGKTSLVMAGKLVTEAGEIQESIGVADAANVGDDTALDQVVATADENLLIGSIDSSLTKGDGTDIGGVKVKEQVATGFAVSSLELPKAKDANAKVGVVITNKQAVTLGGSAGGDIISVKGDTADNKTDVKVVIGTTDRVAGTESTVGTLTIGNALASADTQYKLKGEAVINGGSTLNVNGTTEITEKVTLNSASVNVNNGALLTTAALNVDDSSSLTGNASVSDTVTIKADKVLSVGNSDKAGVLSVKNLTGGTVFLDPAWKDGNTVGDASGLAVEDVSSISSTLIAGQNSKIALGTSNIADADAVFAKTGKTWGENGITAGVYVASNAKLGTGSITADGSKTSAPATSTAAGTVNFAANSILMVNGEEIKSEAAISGVKSTDIDSSSTLYIDNAAKNQTYKILAGTGIESVWENSNIISQNRLLKFEGKTSDGKTSYDVTSSVQKIADVYGNAVIAPNVYDEALAGDNALGNFALDVANSGTTESQVSALNSVAAMSELAGVAHGTFTAHNLLTDTVAEHISMANALTHDNDVWAKYIHTKEDVDGLGVATLGANYKNQYNGVVIGADVYHNEIVTAGVALTYMDGSISGHTQSAYTDNDSKYYGATLYGNLQFGDTAILGDLTYLFGDNDLTQNNSGKTITGDVDTSALSLGVSVEQAFNTGFGKFVPYAGLRYLHLNAGDYRDSLGLAHDGDEMDLMQIPVGLKYSLDTTQGDWTFRTIAKAGYVWNAGDRDASETVKYGKASDTFSYDVADSGSYQGHIALEAQRGNATFGIGYQYQKGDSAKSNSWSASVNYRF